MLMLEQFLDWVFIDNTMHKVYNHECTMPLHLSMHPSFHPSEYAQDSDEVRCEGAILNLFSEFNTDPHQSSITKTAHHC